VHGDFNGDGIDDIIGSQYDWGGYSGNACIWLGKAQFNGITDLIFGSPHVGKQFGWAKAAGDFNNDGLCDVAISEPCRTDNSPLTIGYVSVYSGNTELRDTTVGNDDNIAIPVSQLWAMTIYPNPLQSCKIKLNLNLTGEGYKSLSGAELQICNLKGQEIYRASITGRELKSGIWRSKQLNLKSGVYLVSIKDTNKTYITKKLTIVK
jgi:hypothetical protein